MRPWAVHGLQSFGEGERAGKEGESQAQTDGRNFRRKGSKVTQGLAYVADMPSPDDEKWKIGWLVAQRIRRVSIH